MSDLAESGVVVIGLGRFGISLAEELVDRGVDVLGIDNDPRIVQQLTGSLTQVMAADCTDADTLRQLGVQEFSHAVVAIGTDLEASILAASLLVDLGVQDVWAKAINREHGKILDRLGVHHVVLPEHDMGERVAHLVTGRMLDFIEFEDNFAMVKTSAPAFAVDKRLGETRIRSEYGVTVVCIKRSGEDFTYATQDTVIRSGDTLIVAGTTTATESFANLT